MAQRILALDIGTSGIKLAEFIPFKDGGLELIRYAISSIDLDPQSESERGSFIAATIRELMMEEGIKAGPVLIAVAGQSVFSRYVKIPPVDSEKLAQLVQYEAAQNVPFPMEEVVWDYQLIGGSAEELDVLLVAIKEDIITELTNSVWESGLEADLVDVAPMAIFNTIMHNYKDLSGCTLVLDMGSRSTDLIFIEDGRIFNRSIPVAGNAITQQIMREFELGFEESEALKREYAFVSFGGAYESPKDPTSDKVSKCVRSVMTKMHAEINRSINFYRGQQSGSSPTRILLTGGTSIIPYSDTFLQEKLEVEVEYLNPFQEVMVDPSIDEQQIGQDAHVLSEVVGLGLRAATDCPIELNLLPPASIKEKKFRKKQPLFLGSMVAVVLAVAMWGVYFFQMNRIQSKHLSSVSGEVQTLESVKSQLSREQAKYEIVYADLNDLLDLDARRYHWDEIMHEIRAAIPQGMWLATVRPVPVVKEGAGLGNMPPPGGRAGQDDDTESTEEVGLTEIELAGLGYLDYPVVRSGEAIETFRDRLAASPLFSEETKITQIPLPSQKTDFVRSFVIMVKLEVPIPE